MSPNRESEDALIVPRSTEDQNTRWPAFPISTRMISRPSTRTCSTAISISTKLSFTAPAHSRPSGSSGVYIRFGSKLDPRLRELAILQVGWLARSPYEWSHHVKIGYDFGVSPDDIRALIDETDGKDSKLEPIAKLVCKGAREMTNDIRMSDATFNALQKHFNPADLNDLIITTAFYSAVVRILATLEVDVEDSYMKYLEQFPLPKAK